MPVLNNFERGARAEKKRIFFGQNVPKKCLKTPFLACFFKILPAAQKFGPKQGPFSALGDLGKSLLSV